MTTEFIGKTLASTVSPEGKIQISLTEASYSDLKPTQVLIKVEATPINPSDIGVMFSASNSGSAQAVTLSDGSSVLETTLPKAVMPAMRARLNVPFPCGNEGAGTVVAAGNSDQAQALMGKRVAVRAGGMYAQYRVADLSLCVELPAHISAEQGASCFVNPLTVLAMIETMRMDGHTAICHTAAASNLGQMLIKACQKDGIQLVNIVRKQAQVDLLKSLGAKYVVNSSADDFQQQLVQAFVETSATIAFDATGGGTLANNILEAMEQALNSTATEFNTYGTSTHKQVYLYGGLERSPTVLNRTFGMFWSIGGFLVLGALQRFGAAKAKELQMRIISELDTTFASTYTQRISLDDMMSPAIVSEFAKQATGEKYIVHPNG